MRRNSGASRAARFVLTHSGTSSGESAATRIQPSRSICTVRPRTPMARRWSEVHNLRGQEQPLTPGQLGDLVPVLGELADLLLERLVDLRDGPGELSRLGIEELRDAGQGRAGPRPAS